jgi:hypothetical protein
MTRTTLLIALTRMSRTTLLIALNRRGGVMAWMVRFTGIGIIAAAGYTTLPPP